MGNNPIRNTDFLGDKLSGTDRKSAERELEIIKNSITGNGAKGVQDLFKLKGMKFKSISDKKLQQALSKIDNPDTKKLVEGYVKAINSTDKMFVSVITKKENVQIDNNRAKMFKDKTYSSPEVGLFGMDGVHGSGIEQTGGGRTIVEGNASLSVIVMDSEAPHDYTDKSTGKDFQQPASAGELSSHEILGHALGVLNGTTPSSAQDHINSINYSNIYRRANNIVTDYRNGVRHGGTNGGRLSKEIAEAIPDY